MNDILIAWKKITRGLPKGRKFVDDRAATIEEIHKLIEDPDRRIKVIVYTTCSSEIRLVHGTIYAGATSYQQKEKMQS